LIISDSLNKYSFSIFKRNIKFLANKLRILIYAHRIFIKFDLIFSQQKLFSCLEAHYIV